MLVSSMWRGGGVSPSKSNSKKHNVIEAAKPSRDVISPTQKRNRGKHGFGLFRFFSGLGKTYCRGCHKKCSGEVLRVNDVYFHTGCFSCAGCSTSLSHGGFFTRADGDSLPPEAYFCPTCYQQKYGTKCAKCNSFVEGEVVTALGQTYHQKCFRCAGCDRTFPTGERVTFTGNKCFCPTCAVAPVEDSSNVKSSGNCSGCKQELRCGQALLALGKQYHVWCFKCKACGMLLHGEYMGGKDDLPYCERCYQSHFGVKCSYCFRFISGKVLQAGDNNHFHPTCARCTKCGEIFGDGEEMFLQGAAIWHPRCGPGPAGDASVTGVRLVNGMPPMNEISPQNTVDKPPSPGNNFRHRRRGTEENNNRRVHSRSTTLMAAGPSSLPYTEEKPAKTIYASSSTYSLRRPLEPGDRGYPLNGGTGLYALGQPAHFHLPASRNRHNSSAFSSTRQSMESLAARGAAHRSNSISTPYRPYSTPLAKLQNGIVQERLRAYPMHMLFTSNFKLPPDVQRCNLEAHLDDSDFALAFGVSREVFYRMPVWRRNDLKRQVQLF